MTKIQMTKTKTIPTQRIAFVLNFELLNFGFVSDFDIRISNLLSLSDNRDLTQHQAALFKNFNQRLSFKCMLDMIDFDISILVSHGNNIKSDVKFDVFFIGSKYLRRPYDFIALSPIYEFFR